MVKLGFILFLVGLIFVNVMVDDVNLKVIFEKMGVMNVCISDLVIFNFKMVSLNEGVVYISNDGYYVLNG